MLKPTTFLFLFRCTTWSSVISQGVSTRAQTHLQKIEGLQDFPILLRTGGSLSKAFPSLSTSFLAAALLSSSRSEHPIRSFPGPNAVFPHCDETLDNDAAPGNMVQGKGSPKRAQDC